MLEARFKYLETISRLCLVPTPSFLRGRESIDQNINLTHDLLGFLWVNFDRHVVNLSYAGPQFERSGYPNKWRALLTSSPSLL